MKKKILAFILVAALMLCLVACGSSGQEKESNSPSTPSPATDNTPESAPEPLVLSGEWKQSNSNSDEMYHAIYISETEIEVYWLGEDTISLYWAGTYKAPAENADSYTWDSENDHNRTSAALLASEDDTKTFTYKDGIISYSVSAFGETMEVEAVKQEWGYSEIAEGNSDKNGSEEYEITYSNVKTYTNSIGTTYAQVIVEIENTGTTDLYLSSGSYDLEDANGKLITSNSMVTAYPEVISPGEKAYMYEEDMLDEAVEGELTVLPRPSVEKAKVDKIRYSVTDLEIASDKYGQLKAKGRVENTTSKDEDGMIYVVIILKDSRGTPIGQIFTIIMEDLAAGSKIGFEASGISLPGDVTSGSVAETVAYAYPIQFQF